MTSVPDKSRRTRAVAPAQETDCSSNTSRIRRWVVWTFSFHADSWDDAEEALFGAQSERGFEEARFSDLVLPRGTRQTTGTPHIVVDSPRWMPVIMGGHRHGFRGEYAFVKRDDGRMRKVERVQTYFVALEHLALIIGFSEGETLTPQGYAEGALSNVIMSAAKGALEGAQHGTEGALAGAAGYAVAKATELATEEFLESTGYVTNPPRHLATLCQSLAWGPCKCKLQSDDDGR